MKKFFFATAVSLCFISLIAQNDLGKANDAARIPISVYVPNNIGDLTPKAQKVLTSRLQRIITKNGLGGSFNDRFILTAKIDELGKDFVPGSPPVYNYDLEITLMIGDAIEGTLFASHSIEVRGAGNTESSAYISAIKKIKDSNRGYQDFLSSSKSKIIEYYNSKCDFILKEAESLIGQNQYDEAIANLVSIPEVCKDCFDKAMDLIPVVYKSKLEYECQQNITYANVEIANDNWSKAADHLKMITPDLTCYSEASEIIQKVKDHQCAINLGKAKGAWSNRNANEAAWFLGNITSDSKCASDAEALSNEIASHLDEREKQQWDFQLKQQQDDVDIRKSEIEAARAIGVAYGENQPKTVYKISSWWY